MQVKIPLGDGPGRKGNSQQDQPAKKGIHAHKHRIRKPLLFFITLLLLVLLAGASLFYIQNKSYISQTLKESSEPSFEVDHLLIKILLKEKEFTENSIRIMNTAEHDQLIGVQQEGLQGIISFDSSTFELKPGQTKILPLRFTASDETQNTEQRPGVYIGRLVAESASFRKEIPMIVEIESTDVFFDANVNPVSLERQASRGGDITIEVRLFNLQSIDAENVDMQYAVKDIKGNTLITEHESVVVKTQTSFFKTVPLPKNLLPGPYVFGAEARFGDSVGTSSYLFEVVDPKLQSFSQSLVGFCRQDPLCTGLSASVILLLLAVMAYFYLFIGAFLYRRIGKAVGTDKRQTSSPRRKSWITELVESWRESREFRAEEKKREQEMREAENSMIRKEKENLLLEKERLRSEAEKDRLQLKHEAELLKQRMRQRAAEEEGRKGRRFADFISRWSKARAQRKRQREQRKKAEEAARERALRSEQQRQERKRRQEDARRLKEWAEKERLRMEQEQQRQEAEKERLRIERAHQKQKELERRKLAKERETAHLEHQRMRQQATKQRIEMLKLIILGRKETGQKKPKSIQEMAGMEELIIKGQEAIQAGKIGEARKLYQRIVREYNRFSIEEKRIVYGHLTSFYGKLVRAENKFHADQAKKQEKRAQKDSGKPSFLERIGLLRPQEEREKLTKLREEEQRKALLASHQEEKKRQKEEERRARQEQKRLARETKALQLAEKKRQALREAEERRREKEQEAQQRAIRQRKEQQELEGKRHGKDIRGKESSLESLERKKAKLGESIAEQESRLQAKMQLIPSLQGKRRRNEEANLQKLEEKIAKMHEDLLVIENRILAGKRELIALRSGVIGKIVAMFMPRRHKLKKKYTPAARQGTEEAPEQMMDHAQEDIPAAEPSGKEKKPMKGSGKEDKTEAFSSAEPLEGRSRNFRKYAKSFSRAAASLDEGRVEDAKRHYLEARTRYIELDYGEKKEVFRELNDFYESLAKKAQEQARGKDSR